MYAKYIQYVPYSPYTLHTLRTKFRHVTFSYYSLSHSSIGSIIAHATFTNSLSSALSSCDT